MTEETPRPKRKMRVLMWCGGCLLSLFFLCVIPEVVAGVISIGLLVMFGWALFLVRVSQQIEVDWAGFAIGVAALALLIFGIRRVLNKYNLAGFWTISRTAQGVGGVIGLCLGGIFLLGLGHELSWIKRPEKPWFLLRNSWDITVFPYMKSKNQLKTIGLAVDNYHEVFGSFPIGGSFRNDGTAEHGWITAILPQMDHADLYHRIQHDSPWYHKVNRSAFETSIPEFGDPRMQTKLIRPNGYAPTYYAANDRILNANSGLSISRITDGTSSTIFAGEVKDRIHAWGDVTNWRSLDLGLNKSPNGFGSLYPVGVLFLMADGTVRLISMNVDPKTLDALATPNAKDLPGDF